MSGTARQFGELLALAIGTAGALGCCLWAVMLLLMVAMGAHLHSQWQNGLTICLFGIVPALLAIAALFLALKRPNSRSQLLLALAPLPLMAFGPLAGQAGLWPIG